MINIKATDFLNKAKKRLEQNSKQYGSKKDNFILMANIYNQLINKDITPIECCTMLISLKLSRQYYEHKNDNIVDLIGYIAILGELYE